MENNIDRYCLEKSDFTTYKGVIKRILKEKYIYGKTYKCTITFFR